MPILNSSIQPKLIFTCNQEAQQSMLVYLLKSRPTLMVSPGHEAIRVWERVSLPLLAVRRVRHIRFQFRGRRVRLRMSEPITCIAQLLPAGLIPGWVGE